MYHIVSLTAALRSRKGATNLFLQRLCNAVFAQLIGRLFFDVIGIWRSLKNKHIVA
jgi:hypothetical protein